MGLAICLKPEASLTLHRPSVDPLKKSQTHGKKSRGKRYPMQPPRDPPPRQQPD